MSDLSSATEHIQQHQTDWEALLADLGCSLTFIISSLMFLNVEEVVEVYLRVWISVGVVQCSIHVVCVCLELKRKWDRVVAQTERDENSDSSNVVINHGQEEQTRLWIVFLVLVVFFVVICAAVVSVRFAICFLLQHAILSAMEDQKGKVDSFLRRIPRYRFQRHGVCGEKQNEDPQDEEIEEPLTGKMTECNIDTPIEHVLPLEDAVRFRYLLP
ncbi:E3 ubiquitin-protein ligase At1g63170 [Daucus carota subsp. sativus]|uniref:E3 ubiquitin-protein ligase At1g63170 n=1 Tax=Daucus carota subsp. sativus TaxID=79200 RepID=UPI003082A123